MNSCFNANRNNISMNMIFIQNNYFNNTRFNNRDNLLYLINEYFNNNEYNNVAVFKIIPRGNHNRNYIKVLQTGVDEIDCMVLCDKECYKFVSNCIRDIYSNKNILKKNL